MPKRVFQSVSRLSAVVALLALGVWVWDQRGHEDVRSPEVDRGSTSSVARQVAIEGAVDQEIAVRPSDPANAVAATPPTLEEDLEAMLTEIPDGDEGKRLLEARLTVEREALEARRRFMEGFPEDTPQEQRELAQRALAAHEASVTAVQQKLVEQERESH